MLIMPNTTILTFKGHRPKLAADVLIASGACLIGDVEIGVSSSIWFNTTLRGDVHYIRIGARTNIQDNTVVHVTEAKAPTVIGSDVTIGHSAVIHGCTIEDLCLIGMGAVVLDGARIRERSFVAAGALVPPGKEFPPGSLIKGMPARVERPLTEKEIEGLRASAQHYVDTAADYKI